MPSGLFRLNTQDLIKGLVTAVIGALVAYFSNPTTDFSKIDWAYLIKTAIIVAVSYLGKNLITDEKGGLLGSNIGKTE